MAQATKAASKNGKQEQVGEAQANDAAEAVAFEAPYTVEFTLEGTSTMLFHRWSNESVAAKSAAKKNSAAKKTDDIASYVYRDEKGDICLPGVYVKGAIAGPQGAAKYRQDPRSPRKSALDLFRAGVVMLTELASLGTKEWDFLDERRVMVQRNGITRVRPAFLAGWQATFQAMVQTPEYITSTDLLEVLSQSGRLVGVADFRPTYGRFAVVKFEVLGSV